MPKVAHRTVVPIRWHGHKMRRAADVDACGIGIGQRQWFLPGRFDSEIAIALCLGLLHH